VLAGPERRTIIACVADHWKRDEVLKARNASIVALPVDVPGTGKP
jgi:hypothetical protein